MSTDAPARPAPVYLLAGGPGSRRTGGDPLLARVLATCGVPSPSVAYVGAASSDNRAFFLMLSRYLRQGGAGQVTLAPLAGRRARLDRAQAILEAADMVFVSGGDVEVGMRILEQRRVAPLFRRLYEGGKPFFGISAGSIMLARQWVCWTDPDDDSTACLFPCLGLAPVLCDTHGEGDRWVELRALLRLSPAGTVGYGIPTGAALAVYPDGALESLGAPVHCYAHRNAAVLRLPDLPPP